MKDQVHEVLRQYFYEGLTESEVIHKVVVASGYRNPQSWTYKDFRKGRTNRKSGKLIYEFIRE